MATARREIDAQLAKLRAKVVQLDTIINSLARPFETLDAEVEQQLTLLALTVGKQMVRRELKTDPAQIIGVIRESVGRLPVAARDVRVHLHPEDASVVREHLATPTNDRAWSVVEDPAMSRGGCVVRSDTSQIDARLDARMNAVVAAAFGDERAPGRAETPEQAQ
jgi:flagellar assembly protein FliH